MLEKNKEKKILNVAVIGIGNMGRHHARVYSELEGVKLVAISDLNQELTKKLSEKFTCDCYEDYNKMLEENDIDIISIAVPTSMHKKIVLDVLKRGVNILIEKPIAGNIEEAKEIIDAVKNAGVKATVGHIERFNPVVRKVKEIIDSGELGEVISIVAKRVGIFPPQIKDANVIVDLGVHDIDICSYLLGEKPLDVYGVGGMALIDKREDHGEIILKYNNANAIIQTNWITPIKIRNISITGTKGYLKANYITQTINVFNAIVDQAFDDFGDFVIKFGEPKHKKIEVLKKEPLMEELNSFIECVREDKEPEVTLADAFNALEVALKASGK